MLQETVEDGGGGGDITDEFTPFLDGAVGGHERGAVFVASHDDFKEVFSGHGRQLLESHVVNDQEVGFEVSSQGASLYGLKVFEEGLATKSTKDTKHICELCAFCGYMRIEGHICVVRLTTSPRHHFSVPLAVLSAEMSLHEAGIFWPAPVNGYLNLPGRSP